MKQYFRICLKCGKISPHKISSRGFIKCLRCKNTYKAGFEARVRMLAL